LAAEDGTDPLERDDTGTVGAVRDIEEQRTEPARVCVSFSSFEICPAGQRVSLLRAN
jgi:hypothetical protein